MLEKILGSFMLWANWQEHLTKMLSENIFLGKKSEEELQVLK